MPSDHEKVTTFLTQLAGAVTGAIKSGTADDRKRLILMLKEMDSQMPAISEDTAGAKEFLQALMSLLDGKPVGPEALSEPYNGIYAAIIKDTLADAKPEGLHSEDEEMKEFLTQLAATVIMVMQKGTDDEKKNLAGKLREVRGAIPPDKKGVAELVLAFVSIIEGSPVDADALPSTYAHFYRKVTASIKSGSR